MTPPRFRWLLVLLLAAALTAELAAQWWVHRSSWEPAPVFSLQTDEAAKAGFTADPQDAAAVRHVFAADRAWGGSLTTPDGLHVRAHSVEWDRIPRTKLDSVRTHDPEVCNSGRGYRLIGGEEPRRWNAPDREHVFTTYRFDAPDGTPVVIFALGWLEGVDGFRPDENPRVQRMRLVSNPPRGAARILQVAVTGTANADTAWRAVEQNVLPLVTWTMPADP